jgi:hypothetical protein
VRLEASLALRAPHPLASGTGIMIAHDFYFSVMLRRCRRTNCFSDSHLKVGRSIKR